MVKHVWGGFFLALLFGLPFLAMQDLFPLHRYGMFARSARSKSDLQQVYRLEIRHPGHGWARFSTGNAYFDSGYIPEWCRSSSHSPEFQALFARNIRASFSIPPDSLRIRVSRPGMTDSLIWLP